MPQPSRHRVRDIDAAAEAMRERGVNPAQVSYPCVIDMHEDCTGKVRKSVTTYFVRCLCPDCNHQPPRVLRNR